LERKRAPEGAQQSEAINSYFLSPSVSSRPRTAAQCNLAAFAVLSISADVRDAEGCAWLRALGDHQNKQVFVCSRAAQIASTDASCGTQGRSVGLTCSE
jgi:hypothetical protein